jgi:hypothetical protein
MEKFMAEGAHARVTSHSGNEGRSNRTVTMNIDCGDASVVIQQQIAVNDDLVSQGIRRLEKMVDVFRDVTDSSRAKSMIGKLQIWLTEDEDQKMLLQQRAHCKQTKQQPTHQVQKKEVAQPPRKPQSAPDAIVLLDSTGKTLAAENKNCLGRFILQPSRRSNSQPVFQHVQHDRYIHALNSRGTQWMISMGTQVGHNVGFMFAQGNILGETPDTARWDQWVESRDSWIKSRYMRVTHIRLGGNFGFIVASQPTNTRRPPPHCVSCSR